MQGARQEVPNFTTALMLGALEEIEDAWGGTNGLLPLAHHDRAITESFGKAEMGDRFLMGLVSE